ncbi:PTS fructose transporter subunit IIB [Alkalibaculum sp. M08DMB]|uniref:PTS fructose transporter subunit IIB n=1 Tax=Alkalibaculum sporogenes TaxID=2655001 RepID=A0A6A7KB66_9FIRM|nr:PTS fructose transporter subunit IIB [Alkalibaculum sporogenes]
MKIIAITSCATGIAHSYMSAEALKKIAQKNGDQIKVEIQGAMGIENFLTVKDIEDADLIVFANDVRISKEERFNSVNSKIIHIPPHEVIKRPEIVYEKAKEILTNL